MAVWGLLYNIEEMPKFLSVPKMVLFLIIAGVVVFGFLIKRFSGTTPPVGGPISTPTPTPAVSLRLLTTDELYDQFLEKAKINFPKVATEKKATLSEAPSAIKELLTKEAIVSGVSRLDYGGKETGFKISYTVKNTELANYYRFFPIPAGWQLVKGIRDHKVAILEIENSQYQARFSFWQKEKDILVELQSTGK